MRRAAVITLCLVGALAALTTSSSVRPSGDIVRVDPLAAIAGGAAADSIPLNTEQLARSASLIVTGRALRVESRWTDPRNLSTFVTIAVEQVLKGAADDEVTVAVPGGIDANRRIPIAMNVPGAPRIDENERVLLFLGEAGDITDAYSVVGFAQGKLSIVTNADGRELVTRGGAPRLETGAGLTYSTVHTVALADVTTAIRTLAQ